MQILCTCIRKRKQSSTPCTYIKKKRRFIDGLDGYELWAAERGVHAGYVLLSRCLIVKKQARREARRWKRETYITLSALARPPFVIFVSLIILHDYCIRLSRSTKKARCCKVKVLLSNHPYEVHSTRGAVFVNCHATPF